MTPTQQKALLFGAVVIIASYAVHFIVTDGAQIFSYRPALRPKPKQKPPETPPPPKPVVPVVSAATPVAAAPPVAPVPELPLEFRGLAGIWRGRAAIPGRGTCDMRFELREKDDVGSFSGFTTLTCVSAGPLVAKPSNAAVILNETNPEAAILTGTLENGSIAFKVDKLVGADSNGCGFSTLSLTPFGDRKLASKWQEPMCAGGHIILMKAVR